MSEINNENKRLKSKERLQKNIDSEKTYSGLKDSSKLKQLEGIESRSSQSSVQPAVELRSNLKLNTVTPSNLKGSVLGELSPLSILNKFSKLSNIANTVGVISATQSKALIGSTKVNALGLTENQSKGVNQMMNVIGVDSKKKDTIETKFITKLMQKGKKEKAEIILVKALKKVEQELLKKDLLNVNIKDMQGNLKNQNKQTVEKKESALNVKSAKSMNTHLGESSEGVRLNAVEIRSNQKLNSLSQKEVSSNLKSSKVDKQSIKRNVKETYLSKILEKIIENAKPLIRLKKIRIAGATHQKPVALTKKQAETDAIKRIITNAKARSEKSATLKLAKEFEEIYLNTVSNKTLTEVRELHKLAEANKANITLK